MYCVRQKRRPGLELHSFNYGILNKKENGLTVIQLVGHPLSDLKNYIYGKEIQTNWSLFRNVSRMPK